MTRIIVSEIPTARLRAMNVAIAAGTLNSCDSSEDCG
jgi:hypothetical protein